LCDPGEEGRGHRRGNLEPTTDGRRSGTIVVGAKGIGAIKAGDTWARNRIHLMPTKTRKGSGRERVTARYSTVGSGFAGRGGGGVGTGWGRRSEATRDSVRRNEGTRVFGQKYHKDLLQKKKKDYSRRSVWEKRKPTKEIRTVKNLTVPCVRGFKQAREKGGGNLRGNKFDGVPDTGLSFACKGTGGKVLDDLVGDMYVHRSYRGFQ